jgi:hypothetical protein
MGVQNLGNKFSFVLFMPDQSIENVIKYRYYSPGRLGLLFKVNVVRFFQQEVGKVKADF